jgi:ATP-dependent exoDNAse (exonuclease V) alpha subunit
VLVGDHRQLPELQAGGVFRALVARGLAIELTENVRQIHAWERRALDQLRDGRPEPALAAHAKHDRLTVAATGDAARERLVADWVAAGDPNGAVMIARRRAEVADLNTAARPIDAEQDLAASVERARARQAERATERVLRHDRGFGREL